MAAIASTTSTEKTPLNASVAVKGNKCYSRTFTWTAGNGESAGSATTSFKIPANTAIVSAAHKSDQDWGNTTTIAYSCSTTGHVFAAAAVLNETAGTWKSLTLTKTSKVNVPAQGADDYVVVTIADSTTPAVAKTTTTVTLVLCPVGTQDPAYTTLSI
jgi:hypothetical protein